VADNNDVFERREVSLIGFEKTNASFASATPLDGSNVSALMGFNQVREMALDHNDWIKSTAMINGAQSFAVDAFIAHFAFHFINGFRTTVCWWLTVALLFVNATVLGGLIRNRCLVVVPPLPNAVINLVFDFVSPLFCFWYQFGDEDEQFLERLCRGNSPRTHRKFVKALRRGAGSFSPFLTSRNSSEHAKGSAWKLDVGDLLPAFFLCVSSNTMNVVSGILSPFFTLTKNGFAWRFELGNSSPFFFIYILPLIRGLGRGQRPRPFLRPFT
ncbi:hypothetical protein A2U01_0018047, partial [Trifolium medium]|nr:hypothetical protein [Trifolium medium]